MKIETLKIETYFLGVLTGIIITLVGLLGRSENYQISSEVKYFEKPKSFENKKETSFQVYQVLKGASLAREASDKFGDNVSYYGTTVLILGENFYSNQIVIVKNPQIVGTYRYTNNAGIPMKVPVVQPLDE